MKNYIKNIQVKYFLCVNDIDISIENPQLPHLFITGNNGSGKTILLNIICRELRRLSGRELCYESSLHNAFRENISPSAYKIDKNGKRTITTHCTLRSVDYDIVFQEGCNDLLQSEDFILKLYSADRMPKMGEPKNPTKPDMSRKMDLTSQFLYFLSDLKIQELLAKGDGDEEEANELRLWFDGFQELLRVVYDDSNLEIEFNKKLYSFFIKSNGKSFKFTQLSDGYAAILEIVTDLILTMQESNKYIRAYERKGIVLIDEIETHLHLSMQKNIMPLLTKVFPNIQFIVTTHSPFVLNSLDNAIAYDLEHKQALADLNEYSYEALAEGYFKVDTQSSYVVTQLNRLRELLQRTELGISDKMEIKNLIEDLERIPEALEPNAVGELIDLKIEYNNVISAL